MCPVNPKEDRKRWSKGTKKHWAIQKINGRIVDLDTIMSVIALNINGLIRVWQISPIKSQILTNILGFMVSTMFVEAVQFCPCSMNESNPIHIT